MKRGRRVRRPQALPDRMGVNERRRSGRQRRFIVWRNKYAHQAKNSNIATLLFSKLDGRMMVYFEKRGGAP